MSAPPTDPVSGPADRLARVRRAMVDAGVDALLLSVGADLPWLTGYEAMPLERLTLLVVPADGPATLVLPRLEAPRVVERPDVFAVRPYDEVHDPLDVVVGLLGARSSGRLAMGDRTWARFVLDLQHRMPRASWVRASTVTGPLRAVKDAAEVAALANAAEAADRVAERLQRGDIALGGRTEAQVSAELGRHLLDEGHHRVNFAIVAAGPNAASPHHEPTARVIRRGDLVLCDFGGTMVGDDGVGYCSDITRCVAVGEPAPEVADAYAVLHRAQQAAVAAAEVGVAAEHVDAVARQLITDAGYGPNFVHRTGHGIGVEEHEDPYLVAGNAQPLVAGNVFSVEPGIYVDGRWGMRLEDIVVATTAGPRPLNRVDHRLVVVDG